jgi:cytochrome c5
LSKEQKVLSVNRLVSPVVKITLFLSAMLVASSNFADSSEPVVQLAQLSDGFNAEAKYMASCFACHSTGAAGAPKVGDGNVAEWTPRMEKGMDAVVANAINGLNTMPPKGLCFDCTDDDLRAIVEYMVTASN